jgi:hypothetical protein
MRWTGMRSTIELLRTTGLHTAIKAVSGVSLLETHCAFSLTGAGIRSPAQPVARPRDFFLGVIPSAKKHRLPK